MAKSHNRLITALVLAVQVAACGGSNSAINQPDGNRDTTTNGDTGTGDTGSGGNSGTGGDTSTSGTTGTDDGTVTNTAINGSGRNFVNFESGQVRPLALVGDTLAVTNTPASTLEIFSVNDDGLQHQFSVPVGLEPVAVAARNSAEVWVVNHLSDSVSIVDIASTPPRVTKTLLVGDEPRDIVFAGSARNLAYITSANRGQNGSDDTPIDAELFTPGADRANVWVFDANNTGPSLGGDPLTVVSLFGDTPRALATSSDGSKVYSAVLHSGNRTTAIGERPLVKSGPTTSTDGTPQPATGLIVQFDGNNWRDETGAIADGAGTIYNTLIPFSLPDYDVFTLSTTNSPAVIDRISGVGTTLFNMVVNPVNGTLYVSNTEALNVNRFEGHGHSHSTVRGNFARSRVTLINGTTTTPRDLNTHLDHTQPAATAAERQLSVAQPLGMAVSADGQDLYVAAFGSQKIAVYNTTALANGNFNVSDANQITLSAGGPTGVVLDDPRNRLYALTRFDNSVAVVDTQTRTQTATVPLFNPEPAIIKEGRKFLYDATSTSSHGDSSCAMCHVFGDLDALAWDLGNPDASVADNPNTFAIGLGPSGQPVFHPLKGPMTTQSLRGMANAGPMHWRGDRTGSGAVAGETVERAAFREFNGAFPELLGRNAPLSNGDIDAFARFALTINYPPNPIRALDNSLTASQSNGRNIYMIESTTGVIFTCNHCHTVAPVDGHFGTSGLSSVEGPAISQEFKVPHLRNMYTKVGKFGNSGIFSPTSGDKGPQIRGFGFMHDGNMDTLDNFLQGSVFRFSADTRENNQKRSDVINFVMAMDSEMAPIVGQQITLTANTGSDTDARLQLLQQRALVTQPRAECDLIAKGVIDGRMRGYLLTAENQFRSDKQGETVTLQQLRSEARKPDGAITFTCVPPASGTWMGIDRDDNGVLDND